MYSPPKTRKFWNVNFPPDLVHHLSERLGLAPGKAERVIEEVLSYYSESVQAFVARRHGELQRDGHRNREIYAQLIQELQHRRFRAPAFTERQLRRWIYG